jgi:cell division protein FtsL
VTPGLGSRNGPPRGPHDGGGGNGRFVNRPYGPSEPERGGAWGSSQGPQTIVDSGDGRRRLGTGLIALIVLGLTLGATAHVAVHAKRIEVAIALGKEERTYRELTEQRRNLEIEIGLLKDPARVIAIARDQLGMRPPAPEHIHSLTHAAGDVEK